MKPRTYKFEAVARFPDGREEPFVAETIDSGYREGYGHYCTILCPALLEKPYTLYGVDDEQALELAVGFVRNMLGHGNVELIDAQGNKVGLPEFGGVPSAIRYGNA